VAASLDRDAFPRLATTMEEQPPAASEVDPRSLADGNRSGTGRATKLDPRTAASESLAQEPAGRNGPGLTTKNLLREWRVGLENADLAACRTVYSTLVGMVAPADLAPLTTQLTRLADQKEITLRERFSTCASRRDYEGMLAVGRDITRLLPDRPIADEFRRIEPILVRRLAKSDEHQVSAPVARDKARDATSVGSRDSDESRAASGLDRGAAPVRRSSEPSAAPTFRVVR
jgi:hypothetical protein